MKEVKENTSMIKLQIVCTDKTQKTFFIFNFILHNYIFIFDNITFS